MSANYFKKRNGYEVEGLWYPRVTSICKVIAKPGLERWLANQESFASMQRKRKRLTEWGKDVHDIIETILMGRIPKTSADVKPSVDAFLNWFRAHRIRLHGIEKRVFSKDHSYSGTLDVLAEVDGKMGILDLKTSRQIWDDYFIQTAAYFNAYNESAKKKAKTYWILKIDQFQSCKLCGAEKRVKSGEMKISKNKKSCRHKWEKPQGVCELYETGKRELYVEAFLTAKKLWEFSNRHWLSQISNYPQKDKFSGIETKQFQLEFLNS